MPEHLTWSRCTCNEGCKEQFLVGAGGKIVYWSSISARSDLPFSLNREHDDYLDKTANGNLGNYATRRSVSIAAANYVSEHDVFQMRGGKSKVHA